MKLQAEFTVSERRACRVLDQPRTSQRYQAQPRSDEAALVTRMLELVRVHPLYGYRFITAKLRQEGWHVNAKRIYRLWRRKGLKVPKKKRKRRPLPFPTGRRRSLRFQRSPSLTRVEFQEVGKWRMA